MVPQPPSEPQAERSIPNPNGLEMFEGSVPGACTQLDKLQEQFIANSAWPLAYGVNAAMPEGSLNGFYLLVDSEVRYTLVIVNMELNIGCIVAAGPNLRLNLPSE